MAGGGLTMARQAKAQQLIDQAYAILAADNPMTVRQVYYQLVARLVVPNCQASYDRVQRMLVDARNEGDIPMEWIEDRLRKGRGSLHGYVSRKHFVATLPDKIRQLTFTYYRDIWADQPHYIEVWVEKDALSGIFDRVLMTGDYDIGLNVCRGYTSLSAIAEAAQRLNRERDPLILYFGDFDPSGEDMARDIPERLVQLGCYARLQKVALTREQIARYQLPPNFEKETDKRAPAFIQRYGPNSSVELDALSTAGLRGIITEAVESALNMDTFHALREREKQEREQLAASLATLAEQFVASHKTA